MNRKNIGELLLEYKLITEKDLQEGLEYQKKKKIRLGEALVELGKITDDDIEYVLSKQLSLPFVILNEKELDVQYIKTFPSELLIKNNFIPLYETETEIKIVTDDPFREELISELKRYTNKEISISVANGKKIKEILNKIFDSKSEILLHLKTLITKLNDTFFYRIDFLKNNNKISIFIYGCGIQKKYDEFSFQGDLVDEVNNSFFELGYSTIYNYLENNNKQLLSVYPISTENVSDSYETNQILVVSKFGLVLKDLSIIYKSNIFDKKNNLLKSDTIIPGYTHYCLNEVPNITNISLITTPDFINFENEFYFDGFIPEKCQCNGMGCEKCNNLGYNSFHLSTFINKKELIKLMDEKNGKN